MLKYQIGIRDIYQPRVSIILFTREMIAFHSTNNFSSLQVSLSALDKQVCRLFMFESVRPRTRMCVLPHCDANHVGRGRIRICICGLNLNLKSSPFVPSSGLLRTVSM